MSRSATAIALAAALAGCAHVPDLGDRPQPKAAASYASAQTFAAPVRDWPADRWWTGYGDAQLDALVDEALAGSPTLAQAEARVRKADALVEQARGQRAPQVNANASAGELKQSYNNGIPSLFVPRGYNEVARATVDASWDTDLFGRNRANLAAAVSDAEAQRVDAAQTRLVLTSSVVAAYADLTRLYAQRDTTEQAIELRRSTVGLATRRTDQGVANIGEQRQAEAAEGEARQNLAAVDEQIVLTRNRLASLVGAGPDRGRSIGRPAATPKAFGLPANLSLDLVGRRPDVVAARLRADAMASRIKVARAGFYPNVNLTAYLGGQSLGLGNLLKQGSDIGSLSAALSLPIFSGGRLEGAYRGARADYDAAVAAYDATLVQALQEVADAAASEQALDLRLIEARKALVAAEQAARIERLRYEGGLSNALAAITTEDVVITQRRIVADLEARRLMLDAQLVRALGGGFRQTGPDHA
jgi:NodT family efflux transporter outer membrane factor (OMF) lipoprotein